MLPTHFRQLKLKANVHKLNSYIWHMQTREQIVHEETFISMNLIWGNLYVNEPTSHGAVNGFEI